jgi:hemerythrin superfamily protein
MLIYEALREDHRKIEDLLSQLVGRDDGSENRDSLIRRIRDEFVPHARAEETVFYNSLRAIDSAKSIVMAGYQEHFEVESLLRLLQMRNVMDAEWRDTARKLKNVVEHHIREEEGKIFSAAQQLFTKEEAGMMGAAFQKLKNEIADESAIATTMELVANLMPPRFAKAFRSFNLESRL